MSTALNNIRLEMKEAILADYLSGIEMKEIAKKYGLKHVRTCYHHISPLTQEQKLERMQNKAKRGQEALANENNSTN